MFDFKHISLKIYFINFEKKHQGSRIVGQEDFVFILQGIFLCFPFPLIKFFSRFGVLKNTI
jgi:hypothetical protein